MEHFSHERSPVVLQYLVQFAELLPAFPAKRIAEVLALYMGGPVLYYSGYYYIKHFAGPDQTEIIEHLLPKLSINSLLEAVIHEESGIRCGALRLLAEYPDPIPLEPILAALHDPDYRVRSEAIVCLQKRQEKLPIQPVIACLQDSVLQVRVEAINALASLGLEAPLAELIALVDEPAQEVRAAAILALAQPGLLERVPVEIFSNALGEEYPFPRPGSHFLIIALNKRTKILG